MYFNIVYKTGFIIFTRKFNCMTPLEAIKNNLIDRILATNNEKLLTAIEGILESTQVDEKIHLSSEQLEMLYLSENDIETGKLISEEDLGKSDSEWLN